MCFNLPFNLKIIIIFPSLSKSTLLFSFYVTNTGHDKDQQFTKGTEYPLRRPGTIYGFHFSYHLMSQWRESLGPISIRAVVAFISS